MRVAIIGGGPVGLVSGTVLASVGHEVQLVDIDARRVSRIAKGEAPFHEPGLDALLRDVVQRGKLTATGTAADAVPDAEAILICVGTPPTGQGADLSFLRSASEEVGRALKGAAGYRAIAVKSTVPPGTTAQLVEPTLREHSGLGPASLGVGMNPEFLREGVAVQDMREPDRIVLGVTDERTKEVFTRLYAPFRAPMVFTTPTGAEMSKYASNALLSTLVSFSNEIAALCESVDDADAVEVLRAVHADRRFRASPARPDAPAGITTYILPGLGYGGSCFPKDTEALSAWARARSVPTPVLDAVRQVNAERPERVLDLLRARLTLPGARVAVLGLAFKPETDDLRESRSVDLVRLLHAAGAEVRACDPMAAEEGARLLDGTAVVTADADSALRGADAAIFATAWPSLLALDPAHVKTLMRRPLVLDGRRGLNATEWALHCEYLPIGVKA
ncbi:MAG: UDP-glucose/GDP-mannose dehydrogenase family protein [Gemmatimonadaceae bacterium]